MLKILSKKIIALRGIPRIYDAPFDSIQEWLNGVHPLSPAQRKYDTNKPRLTIPDLSPVGPDAIKREKGDKSSLDNASSGYNQGLEPGGTADDETGPGFTRTLPNTNPQVTELAFRSEGDLSSNLFLNRDSRNRDKSKQQLQQLYGLPDVDRRKWQRKF